MEVNQAANPAGLAENQQCRKSKESESKKGEWSDDAISCLIDAYEMKWNKRNRGNLRVGDWEEVAISVSSRCNGSKPAKTSTQCKNKIEGMKKRYRLEAMESGNPQRNGSSSWPFFERMNSLLHSGNKSVIDVLPGGLDPGGLGLGLGFSELGHNGFGAQASLRGDDEGYAKPASMCHGDVGYPKQVSLRTDDDGATAMLCADDVRQVPFSHLQLLQGNGDLRGHAFFPEEDEQDDEEDEGLQEAESKHEAISQMLLQRKENSETSAHGCKSVPLPIDTVATGLAINTRRADRKPCAKQKKHIHNEVLASIRTFAESILKLEHAKMEMYKDAERLRAEAEARRADLELRRTQMIMNTQLEIAKFLASNSSTSKKNMKKKMKKKETKAPSKNGIISMDAEPVQTSLEQVEHVEAIPFSSSASGNDFEG
eukprot:c18513_g1_i1 orf=549-1829(+)